METDTSTASTTPPFLPLTSATSLPPIPASFSTSKKRRRELSNAQRAEIRKHAFSNATKPSQKEIIQWFEEKHYHTITQSQVSKILSKEYSFLDEDKWQEKNKNKSAQYPDLEAALHHWQIMANRSGKITVTGDVLQEMALKIWHKLPQYVNLDPPKFSAGWLSAFKARHDIKKRKRHGEAAEVDKIEMEKELQEIRKICDLYPLQDIFNMDETALNYRASPDSSLSSESVPGGKLNKARVTANFCCNADGSQKMQPWFIGTAQNPRSFGTGKNRVEVHNLGLVWRYNKKAWMTAIIFREYLRWLNFQMADRKILLLLDGFSSHRAGLDLLEDTDFPNVRVEFLPANTTSICQPLDQGIIRTFKAHYKRRWLQYQLHHYERGEDPHQKMNILQALRWATEAWRDGVTETTIANCWLKARVLAGQMTPPTRWKAQREGWEEMVQQDEASYVAVVNLAQAAIKELEKRQFIYQGIDVATFLDPPDEIIADTPDDDDVLEQITQVYATGPDVDEDSPNVPIPVPILIPQALDAVITLRSFAEQQKEDYTGLIRQLDTLDRDMKALQVGRRSQSTLDRFLVSK